MGIGASGRSLSSIQVPNGRELPFWVGQEPEGECGVKPISRFEKGRSWVEVGCSPSSRRACVPVCAEGGSDRLSFDR